MAFIFLFCAGFQIAAITSLSRICKKKTHPCHLFTIVLGFKFLLHIAILTFDDPEKDAFFFKLLWKKDKGGPRWPWIAHLSF